MEIEQLKQLESTLNEIIKGDRFTTDQLAISTGMPKETLESEEFSWYSKMYLAIQEGEELSADEKIHFLAMYRTFLQFVS
jgi:hypothetical protein